MMEWLTPQRLDKLPDSVVNLVSDVEMDIISRMAERINAQDYFNTSSQWQYQKLKELGLMQEDIEKMLASATGKSLTEIRRIIQEACIQSLGYDDMVYNQAGNLDQPFNLSQPVSNAINSALQKTNNTFRNITGTTATAALNQFSAALDNAWMQVVSGGFSHTDAVYKTVKKLSEQGLYHVGYKGRKESLDVAVRRAVLTGVNQTVASARLARAMELGCELVETTAHSGARPTHEVWQGKVFSLYGDGDYPDFYKATGYGTGPGLCGWNCRHSFHPYYEGMSRAYSEEDLAAMSEKSIKYNGEMLTEYEASQKQRYIERQIRRWKREYKALDAAGLDASDAAKKLRDWHAVERRFIDETGLKKAVDRTRVYGFGRSEAGKVKATNNIIDSAAEKNFKFPLTSDKNKRIIKIDESKDFKELQLSMIQKYGRNILRNSVSKLKFENVKEGILGIDAVFDEFPAIRKYLKSIEGSLSLEDDVPMEMSYTGTIHINMKTYDYVKGFGSMPKWIGAHEAGHFLERAVLEKEYPGNSLQMLEKRGKMWNDSTKSADIIKKATLEVQKVYKLSEEELRSSISWNASLDYSEAFAECVADYIINAENAKPLSKAVWNIIKNIMG